MSDNITTYAVGAFLRCRLWYSTTYHHKYALLRSSATPRTASNCVSRQRFYLANAQLRKSCNMQKGNVLIIAMIIGAGMLVAAVEVSMFVASTIRQARAIDHTLVAQYAAESATENALHQVRKEFPATGRTTLRSDMQDTALAVSGASRYFYTEDGRDARWSFLNSGGTLDTNKFNAAVQKITKSRLREQESLDIHLWKQDASGFSSTLNDFATMTVQWKKTQCQDPDPNMKPWIEATALAFSLTGNTIQWNDTLLAPVITKQFKSPGSATSMSIPFTMAAFIPEGQSLDSKGLTLRIKPFFCSLRGVEIFFQKSDGTILAIPNYYFIRPTGTFGNISKDLQALMPSYPSATGIFDYLLFSDEAIEKVE